MKFNLESPSNLERKLHVEIPVEKVKGVFDRVFKSLQREATVKGFRKGKAPLDTIRNLYKDRVGDDVVRELVGEAYSQALDEHALTPIGYPNIDFDQINEDAPFKFVATFEVRPEIKLKKYQGLEAQKEKLTIDDRLVDGTLERLRQSRAKETPLLIERPIQNGDLATIDFDGEVDGQKLENGSAKDHVIEVGSSGFIPGFDEGLLGMSTFQARTLDLKFPEDYHVKTLAGKPVQFKVILKKLGKKEIPDLTDDFATSVGATNIDDLKKRIREDIEKNEFDRIKKDLRGRILKALVDANPLEVPPSLLREQKQVLINDVHQRMEAQGMKHDQFEDYTKKWDKDFDETANFIVRSSLLVNAIADEQKLKASEADVDARLNEYAATTGIDLPRLKEFYGKQEQKSNLRFQITEEKVVDYLISQANLVEVDAKDLPQED